VDVGRQRAGPGVDRRVATRAASAIVCTRPPLSASTPESTPVLGSLAPAANTVSSAAKSMPLMVVVGVPVWLAKFTGAEPMTLPPVNTRSAEELRPPNRSSPDSPAALPATIELVRVVVALSPKL
jgi:hypothetical protein